MFKQKELKVILKGKIKGSGGRIIRRNLEFYEFCK